MSIYYLVNHPPGRFLLYSIASNALLQARWDQWIGMILTGAVAYFVSTAASAVFAANVLASFAIGITSTVYSRFSGHLPVTMVGLVKPGISIFSCQR